LEHSNRRPSHRPIESISTALVIPRPKPNANVRRITLFWHGDLSGQQLPIRNFFGRWCRDSFGLLPEFLQAFRSATEGLGFAGMGLALPRSGIQSPNDTRTISVIFSEGLLFSVDGIVFRLAHNLASLDISA
jgi:hypothetical protein